VSVPPAEELEETRSEKERIIPGQSEVELIILLHPV
jgi:hypothetical protein